MLAHLLEPVPLLLDSAGCVVHVHLFLDPLLFQLGVLLVLSFAKLALFLIGLHLGTDKLLQVFVFFDFKSDGVCLLLYLGFLLLHLVFAFVACFLERHFTLLKMVRNRLVDSSLGGKVFLQTGNLLL